MKVTSLILENFRNYEKIEVSTDSDLVLIVGPNAAGKTNFLESIYFLSRLRSFRAADEILIRETADFFRIQGQILDQTAEAVVQKTSNLKRAFKLNGQKHSRGLWRTFRTVLFVPNDLNLFDLGPGHRRKFLDEILIQKFPEYSVNLVSYEHVLKQKSAILERLQEGLADTSELEFWNLQLAGLGRAIHERRGQLLDYFQSRLTSTLALLGFQSEVATVYHSQLNDLTSDQILKKLTSLQTAETASGMNLFGVHRDDFALLKDGQPNINRSSRGELRGQVLGLKLLQAEYLSDEKQKPIILLDDVFSELDEARREQLFVALSGHQIFITSTEDHDLPKLRPGVLVFQVADNSVK